MNEGRKLHLKVRARRHPSPALSIEVPAHQLHTKELVISPDQAWGLVYDLMKAMREEFGMAAEPAKDARWQLGASPDLPAGSRAFFFLHPTFGTLTFVYSKDEVEKLRAELTKSAPFAPGSTARQ